MGKIQIGDSFGCYTVIRIEEPRINSNGKRTEMVTCKCSSCGAINTVTIRKLKRKTSQYCKKCVHIETESLIDKEFGFLKVIERAPNRLQTNGSAKEGDVIKAQLYSWVMDSTGQVARREIHKIY